MIYGSVCSGIEAASVAWHPLGWKASFLSEIEAFPRKVLAHHYPNVPLHGDFTTIKKDDYEPIKLLVGGTPCQSFSVAGLRAGLNDPRGNLMLEFGALAKRLQPKWLVWENVPGVLSSNSGRDFGSFLAMLGELGYGFAYRVLDAQHFGVPQRRRRVFVIGCLGDFGSAAAVLFEQHSLQGHTAPSREKRKKVTELAGTLTANGGGLDRPTGQGNELYFCITVGALDTECGFSKASHQSINAGHILPIAYREADLANYKLDSETENFIPTYALAGNTIGRKPENFGNHTGYDNSGVSYTLTKTDVYAVAFNAQGSSSQGDSVSEHITPTLDKSKIPAVAFKIRGGCEGGGKGYLGSDDKSFTISTGTDQQLFHKMQVRRLMPIECERLQGFPDEYTNIPTASDSTRYKALGNSMAVPVMHWIGKRIDMVEAML